MSDRGWAPRVTVAAVVERDGRYLLIEEHTRNGLRWNQPAGHWERGETLVDAVVRETLEESGYRFTPTALLGVFVWTRPGTDKTFVRIAFAGTVPDAPQTADLDDGIVGPVWVTAEQLDQRTDMWRSPMVRRCIDVHAAGTRLPLDAVHHLLPLASGS